MTLWSSLVKTPAFQAENVGSNPTRVVYLIKPVTKENQMHPDHVKEKATDRWDQVAGYCCGTCRFYSPKDGFIGRCRRNAPTMDGFPVVYPKDDWCGQHKD